MSLNIRIVAPSFVVETSTLSSQIAFLGECGFEVSLYPSRIEGVAERGEDLVEALCAPVCENILCVRGGYGASDLLPRIPYRELQTYKRVVGFSDISALHSALWTRNGFIGIHGAMPATVCWGNAEHEAMKVLLDVMAGKIFHGEIAVTRWGTRGRRGGEEVRGVLFGGCFSVLTNLIGTPYFPSSLAGYILFFEDVNENIGRLLRYLNQWQYSGMLEGVRAIVLGRFEELGGSYKRFCAEFAARVPCPLYVTEAFGHSAPLYPLHVGGGGVIKDGRLCWKLAQGGEREGGNDPRIQNKQGGERPSHTKQTRGGVLL